MYLKYMGAEAYGLVGFFTLIQSLFSILDMGFTSTVSRETAKFNGSGLNIIEYRSLIKAIERIYIIIGFIGGLSLFLLSKLIAEDWVVATIIPEKEVHHSIELMALVVSLRWICGFYRGIIIGFEKLIWLASFNAVIALLRFFAVIPILILIGNSIVIFFEFQLFVSSLELVGLIAYKYKILPVFKENIIRPINLNSINKTLRFSLAITFTSLVGVLITQLDKLLLSKILSLSEYAYFNIGVMGSSLIFSISGPISLAIIPRLVKNESEKNYSEVIKIYRNATQYITVISLAACITIVFCAEYILLAWTGDKLIAEKASPILILYTVGNFFQVLSGFPYYIQFAKGDLRLHLIGNAIFVVLLIPIIFIVVKQFGGIGGGCVWLALNILTFSVWVPIVHNKFFPKLNRKWYLEDIIIISIPMIIFGYSIINLIPIGQQKISIILYIIILGTLELIIGCVASSVIRKEIIVYVNQIIKDKSLK